MGKTIKDLYSEFPFSKKEVKEERLLCCFSGGLHIIGIELLDGRKFEIKKYDPGFRNGELVDFKEVDIYGVY